MQTKSFPSTFVNLQLGAPPEELAGSMQVIMRTRKVYTDGTVLNSGSGYTVSKAWGQVAVANNWAFDANDALPEFMEVSLPDGDETVFLKEIYEQRYSWWPNPVTYASQFAMNLRGLPAEKMAASATGQMYLGPCAIVGVRAITLGSANSLTVHDDTSAGTAANLRFSRLYSTMTAGTYYPFVADDPVGMLFSTGAYVTVPTDGVYVFDVIAGNAIAGLEGSGMLTTVARVAATGLALSGPANIVSVKIIAPGTPGNFSLHDDVVATDALKLCYPATAAASLSADQIIRLGSRGGASLMSNTYVTVPTNGIVLVNYLPR